MRLKKNPVMGQWKEGLFREFEIFFLIYFTERIWVLFPEAVFYQISSVLKERKS